MIASVYKLHRADITALGITDAHGVHRAVYDLFPNQSGQSRDFLFADKGGGRGHREVLILSKRPPRKPEHGQLEVQQLPPSFRDHHTYAFEVVLNPTRRNAATRKLVPVRGSSELKEWFLAKAPKHGFMPETRTLRVDNLGVLRFEKDGVTCCYDTATFSGRLRVTDRELFIRSFEEGIGRAKGHGFGLLQVIPVQG
jgi:CRISPR system Cascade subunit CasE